MSSLLRTGSRLVRATRAACTVRRRPYAAEDLYSGMLIADPDGRLHLNEAQVQVVKADWPNKYDRAHIAIDWKVSGTSITGRNVVGRRTPICVVGGTL